MENKAVKRMRKLNQQFAYTALQMHEAIAARAGLTGTDHKYLGFLIERGQMTAGELSALTGLTTGAVTGLIDRFEKKGFVTRVFLEKDRRKVYISPETDKIMEIMAPLYKDFRNATAKLTSTLSDKEVEVIENYFLKVVEIMNETITQLRDH
jgi:DNA-binding MarR family transcriptional regulator